MLGREKEEFEKRLKEANLQYDSTLDAMQCEMRQKEETFQRQMKDVIHSHSEYVRQRNTEDRLNAKKQQEHIRKKPTKLQEKVARNGLNHDCFV